MSSLFVRYYQDKCLNCQLFAECFPEHWAENTAPTFLEREVVKWPGKEPLTNFLRQQQILCSINGYYKPKEVEP